ncbi:lipopolysaccharide biosynthesis protein [Clostridium sp.]|uniref:lipopolysaccharide biosynthesis protein n=1 Tax=Clostridium sp. TaxID=1506 RepID=UPI001ED799C6|nr:lipopolysaccharide biosynthesis protein [Clostridium sp.]MBS5884530.1 lipopolysaccharide biosynthesis protein [Clostridium sp.]
MKYDINNKFLNATKWSAITEVFSKLVSPITNMILARIISPEAFGVVATVTMIISFVDMFTDAGFQKYLVQHEFRTEEELFNSANVAFWTNLLLSIILWLIIIIFRDSIAIIVGNPGLGNVISISCIQILLTSFSSIQMSLYRRNFNFKTLFVVRMISVCIPFFITIPLASIGFSYWALVIGSICIQISNAIILTIKSEWKPKLYYKIGILKEMISFSIWSLIEAISIWLSSWIDMLVIGNYLNEYFLGLYKTSTSMVNVIMTLISASVIPAFFSTLSRLQEDEKSFSNIFFDTQKFLSIIIFPLGIGIYLYRELATNIMLGSNWSDAKLIVGISALTISIKIVLGDLCSEVYRAKGKPKISLLAQILHLIFLVPSCIISIKYGFWTFVYVRSFMRIQFILVHFVVMKYVMKIKVEETIKNIFPIIISTLIMAYVAHLINGYRSEDIIWNFISILICAFVYFFILYLFPSMRKDLKRLFMQFRNK